MTAQVIPFVYNDKAVRTIVRGGEPWFVGKDVCTVLDIRDHIQALNRLDDDERGGCKIPTPSGEQEMIIITEAGMYRLVLESRKPEARPFKRWVVHDVLPAIRKTGRYAVDDAALLPRSMQEEPNQVTRMKIEMVNAARITHGNRYAQALWFEIGLPDLRNKHLGPMPREDEPVAALALLLDTALPPDSIDDSGMGDLRARIERAFDSEEARLSLLPLGIRIYDDPEGFVVSNTSPFIISAFEGTEWQWRRWQRTLRRLPGAHAAKSRFGDISSRGTFIPADLLDVRCPS